MSGVKKTGMRVHIPPLSVRFSLLLGEHLCNNNMNNNTNKAKIGSAWNLQVLPRPDFCPCEIVCIGF